LTFINLKPAKIHGIRYIGDYGFSSLSAALADQGATAGGQVFVPAGTFTMPSTVLSVPYDTQICGAVRNRSKLVWTDATTSDGLSIVPSGTLLAGVELRELTLEASQSKTGNALKIPSCNHVTLEKLNVYNWGGSGIRIDGSPFSCIYGLISDCHIHNVYHGVYANNDVRVWRILNSSIDYCYGGAYPTASGTGVKLMSTYEFNVSEDTIEHVNVGVEVNGGPSNHVEKSYFEAVVYPLSATSCNGSTFLRNYGYNVSYVCALSSPGKFTISDNNFGGVYGIGFYMTGDLLGTVAERNRCVTDVANVPWSFGTITTEPSHVEATWGGTGSLAPRIVRGASVNAYIEQATQPTLTAEGQTMLWRDTDDSKVYLICRINGVDKKVELL
jgi:hypothetical protein